MSTSFALRKMGLQEPPPTLQNNSVILVNTRARGESRDLIEQYWKHYTLKYILVN